MRRLLCWYFVAALTSLTAIPSAHGDNPDVDDRPSGLAKRVPWTTSRIVGTPEPPPPFTVQPAFPGLKFDRPVYVAQEPGTERFLVAELSGKIHAVTRDASDKAKSTLFLDVGRELYSFSFHTDYEQNGHLFTFSPKDPRDKRKPEERLSRVSRFTASLEHPRVGRKESERVIVEWPSGGHNGGEAIMGPDGFLYVSTGDSTTGSDPKGTGQGVDDLLSVIMRIDVDHPTEGRAYSIPKDNPFIDVPGARPEIWAFGFRNPWRMSFDSKTGDLWVGDVGQDLWEMVWKVRRGGNYGWSVREGTHSFHPNKPSGPGPILPPIIEHHHSVCRSITGGYVYRGEKFPELDGAYFYGDYEYGMIWAVRADGQTATWNAVLANTPLRIASFGVSRSGDILIVDHPSGELYELTRAPKSSANQNFPRRLSETGLFQSVADHQVAAGVVGYSVNSPQWVDGGVKQRYLAIPGDGKIGFVARSRNARSWSFPDGAVTMETISLDTRRGSLDTRRGSLDTRRGSLDTRRGSHETQPGDAASLRRIETRIMVRQENHWLGYSYLWNDAQTDARLVEAEGRDITLAVQDAAAPGGVRRQPWHVPSRNECMVCHSRAAAFVLGLRTAQMNRPHDYGQTTENQLRAFDHVGLFESPLEKPPEEYDALADPYDSDAPLDDRARSYLHVNCSVCHVADGGGNARISLRYYEDFDATKLSTEPLHGTFGLPNARVVRPGDPLASVLLYRLSKWGRGRMPHLGSNLHDDRAIKLIHHWIEQLPPVESLPPSAEWKARDAELANDVIAAEQGDEALQQRVIRDALLSTRGAFALSSQLADQSTLPRVRAKAIAIGTTHPSPAVRDLFERFVPIDRRTKRLGNVVDPAEILKLSGDPEQGREFFFAASGALCRNCHRVNGRGGEIGPDLSGVGAKWNPAELLDSLVVPSRRIDARYRSHVLVTDSGKIHTGILREKSAEAVVLSILEDGRTRQVRVPAAEIDELVEQPKSLMPDGLLRDLTPQQAADLLAYLASLKSAPPLD